MVTHYICNYLDSVWPIYLDTTWDPFWGTGARIPAYDKADIFSKSYDLNQMLLDLEQTHASYHKTGFVFEKESVLQKLEPILSQSCGVRSYFITKTDFLKRFTRFD